MVRMVSKSILLILILATAGCGEQGPAVAPASGLVTFNGEPVAYAKVMFFPQNVPGGHMGMAQTDADGKFATVYTAGDKTGAVVGLNYVTVTEGWPPGQEVPLDANGMEKDPPRGPWAQKYRDSTDPALKVEVLEGEDNFFEFELSS